MIHLRFETASNSSANKPPLTLPSDDQYYIEYKADFWLLPGRRNAARMNTITMILPTRTITSWHRIKPNTRMANQAFLAICVRCAFTLARP
mmetsp:Transcript_35435/g.60203  ORF Transcript_35435/g.60203 Transcript_35435/m.60203 type:complete len:91 (-) Transcript_35435:316-588(-)